MKSLKPTTTDTVARHPIAVVAERTGLSADVLRVWERRYGAVAPTRGAGGHRTYSDADIARLRLLHAVTAAGRTISQVARLSTDELARIAEEDAAARAERAAFANARARPEVRRRTTAAADVVGEAVAATGRLDAAGLEHLLRRSVAQFGVNAFVEEVAAPMLRQIGDDWHAGRSTIAHEHLASTMIYDIVMESTRTLARGGGATVLVTTPAGERHAIGAALVAAAAAAEGWRVLYLGADLPAREIAEAAVAGRARAVAVSLTYVHDRERTVAELRSLRTLLPPDVLLIAGGRGASAVAAELASAGVRVGSGLADLRDALGTVARPDAA